MEVCQAKRIKDDPNTYKALLLCLYQTAITKPKKTHIASDQLQQVWYFPSMKLSFPPHETSHALFLSSRMLWLRNPIRQAP